MSWMKLQKGQKVMFLSRILLTSLEKHWWYLRALKHAYSLFFYTRLTQ